MVMMSELARNLIKTRTTTNLSISPVKAVQTVTTSLPSTLSKIITTPLKMAFISKEAAVADIMPIVPITAKTTTTQKYTPTPARMVKTVIQQVKNRSAGQPIQPLYKVIEQARNAVPEIKTEQPFSSLIESTIKEQKKGSTAAADFWEGNVLGIPNIGGFIDKYGKYILIGGGVLAGLWILSKFVGKGK